MNDLISKNKAIQRFIQETVDSNSNLIHINTAKRLLQDVDTAYSVDKVIEELKKHKDTTDLTTVDEEMVVGFTIYQGAFNDAIDKAIEIVKEGVKNE